MTSDSRDAAFEAEILPLLPDCFAFALSLTRNRADAEDLVQETFLRAHRAFATFASGTNAKAWLFTILRRVHVDGFRRARRRPVVTGAGEAELDAAVARAPEAPGPEPDWDGADPERLRRALEAMPEAFRLAVRLRDVHGMTYAEIGEILDVPAGTVMSRIHRGREWLRRTLVDSDGRGGDA